MSNDIRASQAPISDQGSAFQHKRQRTDSYDLNKQNLPSRLSDLLALTAQPTPLLADLSIFSQTKQLLSQAQQFFVDPNATEKNAMFADICMVFTIWLRETECLAKDLLLAVWLADNL